MSALGSLVVRLVLDHAEFTKGLDRNDQASLKFAQNSQKNFDRAEASAKKFFGGVAAGAVGAVAAFVGINDSIGKVKDIIDFQDEIAKLSQATSVSVETLAGLDLAATQSGTSLDRAAKGIRAFSRVVADSSGTMNKNSQILEAMGINLEELKDKTPEEQFFRLADAIQELGADDRAVALTSLLGDRMAELVPLLSGGSDNLKSLIEQGQKFNPVTAEQAARAEVLNDSLDNLDRSTNRLFVDMAIGLVPTLNDVVTATTEVTESSLEYGTSINILDPLIKGLTLTGASLGFVFSSIGREIGATAAKLVALKSLDFDAIVFIDNQVTEDVRNLGRQYDQFVDTVLNGNGELAKSANDAAEAMDDFVGPLRPTPDQEAFALLLQRINERFDGLKNTSGKAGKSVDDLNAALAREGKQLTESLDPLAKRNTELKRLIELLDANAIDRNIFDKAAADSINNFIKATGGATNAIDDETAAADKLGKQLQRVQQITESVITAEERMANEFRELEELRGIPGGLDDESHSRAIQKIENDYKNLGGTATSVFSDIDQVGIQAIRNIQTAFADFLFDPFDDGLKGMLKGFSNVLKRMVAEIASSSILRGFASLTGGGSFLTGASSVFGATGAANSQLTSGLNSLSTGGALFSSASSGGLDLAGLSASLTSGASSALSTGFGATNFISSGLKVLGETTGLELVTSFAAGLGGASTGIASTAASAVFETGAFGATGLSAAAGTAGAAGAAVAAIAGPLIALGVVDAIAGALAGDKVTGTFVDKIPFIGGFGRLLFGRGPLNQKETNLGGHLTSTGFDGATSVKFKAEGGLARDDKIDRIIHDVNTGERLTEFNGQIENGISSILEPAAEVARSQALQLGEFLAESMTETSDALRDAVSSLGIDTSPIDNFFTSVQIASKKGESLSTEQIEAELTRAAEQMSTELIPSINDLTKAGESAFQAVQRLGAEFELLTSAGTITGLSLQQSRDAISGLSFEERTKFINDAGGFENFAKNVNFFSENFLTAEQALAPKSEKLTEDLLELGLSADITIEEFGKLGQTFGDIGGISVELFLGMLDLQESFVATRIAEIALTGQTDELTDSLNDLVASETRILNLRTELVDVMEREENQLQQTIDGFGNLAESLLGASDSLALGNLSPLTPIEKRDEAREQFLSTRSQALSGDQDALAELPEAIKNFLSTSQVVNASGPAFVADFNLAQQTLQDGAEIAISERDIAQSQLDELRNIVGAVIDLNPALTSTAPELIIKLGSEVLLGAGNALISDQAIKDVFDSGAFTPDELLQGAIKNNVSRDQIFGATGINIAEFALNPETINRLTGGLGINDQVIIDAINNPDNAPFDLLKAAVDNGLTLGRIADVLESTVGSITEAINANVSASDQLTIAGSIGQTTVSDQVAPFETDTDSAPRVGRAILNKDGAVGLSSIVEELRESRKETAELRKELTKLREEQNKQTEAMIAANVIALRENANSISKSNQENAKSAVWADRTKQGLR